MKVLISDAVSEKAVDILKQYEGIEVTFKTGLSEDEIVSIIPEYDGLIVRSATKVTPKIIEAASNLKIIGRAGSGVDNINIDSATQKGIVVMNTPGANTISTAEHTFAMMISLARNIPQAHASIKEGKWARKSFKGTELRGKTLGIIGLGNIGKTLANRAFAFNMSVLGYDPFISKEAALQNNIELADLDTIFSKSDFISVHTPLNNDTKHLINKDTLKKCKNGVRIINCARGGIVNEEDLVEAIDSGIVAGAAFDVFENEPPSSDAPVVNNEKIIHTPHLGASTKEAQEIVAVLIAQQMADGLVNNDIRNAINMKSVDAKKMKDMNEFVRLGKVLGSLQYQMAEGQMEELEVSFVGDFEGIATELITTSVVQGLLENTTSSVVNGVNAMYLASKRGLKATESFSKISGDYKNLVSVTYKTSEVKRTISGTIFGKKDVRVVSIDDFPLNATIGENAILYTNDDLPGVTASITSKLAENNINIASMFLARKSKGGKAMVLVNTDSSVQENVIDSISKIDGIYFIKSIMFS